MTDNTQTTQQDNPYGTGKVAESTLKFAQKEIKYINEAYDRREEKSVVFNGLSYSKAYVYNMKKAVNYAPPKSNKDSQISLGIVHEKLVSFVAIFLKYIFKPYIKCYDKDGNLIKDLGDVYKWAVQFSQDMEKFNQKLGVIYWEMFTQGDAFVLEDWQVETIEESVAYKDDKELKSEEIDFTYEFLESLTYQNGKRKQTRKAVSVLLDGRNLILDSMELDSGIQNQEGITIEEKISRDVAEKMYGSLSMWSKVPASSEEIASVVGDKITLFDGSRLKDPKNNVIIHRRYSKVANRFNIFINGLAMLPYQTPFTIFYPRGNYPVTQFSSERLSGSAYSRSIPAKVKFNSDYADWILKTLAYRFEQEVRPGLLVKGKYTLVKDIFAPGARTHGVTTQMYEKADPDNRGIQPASFSFLKLMTDIQERQTANPTTSGELTPHATATEINIVENNQQQKLGYMLDGLVNGYTDLIMRRAETIESKYTVKQRETVVDGQRVDVFQNFTITSAGVQHSVVFDKSISNPTHNTEKKRSELFTKAFNARKVGTPTEYYLVDPEVLRKGDVIIQIEIHTEKIKNTGLKLMEMRQEFDWLLSVFPNVNHEELEKEYLAISGRPESIFTPLDLMKLQQGQSNAQQAPSGPAGLQKGLPVGSKVESFIPENGKQAPSAQPQQPAGQQPVPSNIKQNGG